MADLVTEGPKNLGGSGAGGNTNSNTISTSTTLVPGSGSSSANNNLASKHTVVVDNTSNSTQPSGGQNNQTFTSPSTTTINTVTTTVGTPEVLPKMKPILPSLKDCIYTPYYCEENIYKLCDKIRSDFPLELDYCFVAFISNPKRMIPLWRQRSGKNEEKIALWDYHCVMFYCPDKRCVIYDLESTLPWPCFFERYITETCRTENILQSEYHRFFRLISASKYLALFSSDRSHMKNPDGSWIQPPPLYPPILQNGVNNLQLFLDMDMKKPKTDYGELYSLMELVRRFVNKPKQLS